MQSDVNVRPAILADDVCDALLRLYDVLTPVKADTDGNHNAPEPDSVDDWYSVDYKQIYENATEEEKAEIENELQEIRDEKKKELTRLHDYRKCDKYPLSLVEHSWLVNLLMGFVNEANWRWMFDIWGIDQMELLDYHEDESHYDWHCDTELLPYDGRPSCRKITIIVQLSEPDDYEGCDLELQEVSGMVRQEVDIMQNFKKDAKLKGTVILFPSYQDHRITPLIKGNRRSLVAWAAGPRWK